MRLFTEPDTWNGGEIELLCAMGTATDELRQKCMAAIWSWPDVRGPYERSDREPSEQPVSAWSASQARYGVGILPGHLGEVAFQVSTVEDQDGLWVYAGSPLGSLSRVFPVGAFPFGEPNVEQWEHIVYAWLFELAEHLATTVPFDRAVIGWLTTAEVDELAAKQVPEKRFHGYVVRSEHRLVYYPPNRTSPLVDERSG
jgi:hypothetical protein